MTVQKNYGMGTRHIVTLADIAEQCGVTKMTVSRALRDPERHSPELTALIRKTAQELGYDPDRNHGAQQLAMRKYGQGVLNRLVAVAFPHDYLKGAYFTALQEGISDVLSAEGYGLLMVKTSQLESGLLPVPFRRGDIDGIICYERPDSAVPFFDLIKQEAPYGQPPTVSLISPIDRCSNILADRRQGTSEVIAHLCGLGHRHFLYIHGRVAGAELVPPIIEGWLGYRDACQDLGLDPDKHIVSVPFGNELWELALSVTNHPYLNIVAGDTRFLRHPIIRTLRDHPEITAILAPNDASAILCYHILQTAGYHVPDDISLVGFDDTDPLVVTGKRNILTTVRVPLKQIGRTAAKVLINRVTGEIPENTTKILPTKLVIRETTGPAYQR